MLQRHALPLLVSAFLVAFSLGHSPKVRVPSQVARAGGLPEVASRVALEAPLAGSVRLTHEMIPGGVAADVHVVLDVAAAASAPRRSTRLNLVLALDRSGSMRAEGKLRQAIAAATRLVDRLQPEDTLALVAYSTDAQLLLPAAPVGDGSAAREALAAVRAGGSTNLSEGLALANRQAAQYHGPERLTAILLLSDGKANHGLTERGPLGDLAARLQRQGILLSTFGLGLSYDELILQDLARLGGGEYYFLETAAGAEAVFESELARLEASSLKGVQAILTPAEGTRLLPPELGYPATLFPDGTMRLQLGALEAGEARRAAVRLRVAGRPEGQAAAVVSVRFVYLALTPEGWQAGEQHAALGCRVGPPGPGRDLAPGLVDAAVLRGQVAAVLESAAEGVARGQLEAAEQTLAALEQASPEVEQLRRELRTIEREQERSAWLKRSRAQAFSLRR